MLILDQGWSHRRHDAGHYVSALCIVNSREENMSLNFYERRNIKHSTTGNKQFYYCARQFDSFTAKNKNNNFSVIYYLLLNLSLHSNLKYIIQLYARFTPITFPHNNWKSHTAHWSLQFVEHGVLSTRIISFGLCRRVRAQFSSVYNVCDQRMSPHAHT